MTKESRIRLLNPANLIIGCVVVLLSLFILFLSAYSNGMTTGNEISPDDFSQRRFSYCRAAWLPFTFVGLSQTSTTLPFVTQMNVDGLLAPVPVGVKNWHLVDDNHMPADSNAYDACILSRYLEMKAEDSVTYFWEAWNTKSPKKAAIVWPLVAQLARAKRYYLIPLILDFAVYDQRGNKTPLREFVRGIETIVTSIKSDYGFVLKFDSAAISEE